MRRKFLESKYDKFVFVQDHTTLTYKFGLNQTLKDRTVLSIDCYASNGIKFNRSPTTSSIFINIWLYQILQLKSNTVSNTSTKSFEITLLICSYINEIQSRNTANHILNSYLIKQIWNFLNHFLFLNEFNFN